MLVRDLNRLYRALPALHARDAGADGFRWVVGDDRAQSVFAFLRQAPGAAPVLAVANLTPVPRHDYRLGLPRGGTWREVLNSNADAYGGSGMGNGGLVPAEARASHGFDVSVRLTLPPLAILLLCPESAP
jgi:1,4-alpha-glucan branching enzyme